MENQQYNNAQLTSLTRSSSTEEENCFNLKLDLLDPCSIFDTLNYSDGLFEMLPKLDLLSLPSVILSRNVSSSSSRQWRDCDMANNPFESLSYHLPTSETSSFKSTDSYVDYYPDKTLNIEEFTSFDDGFDTFDYLIDPEDIFGLGNNGFSAEKESIFDDLLCPFVKSSYNCSAIYEQKEANIVLEPTCSTIYEEQTEEALCLHSPDESDPFDVEYLKSKELHYTNRKVALTSVEEEELKTAYSQINKLSLDNLKVGYVHLSIIKPLFPRCRREALRDERVRECKARIWAHVTRRLILIHEKINGLASYEQQREEFLDLFPEQRATERTSPSEFRYRLRFVRAVHFAHNIVGLPASENLLNFLRIGSLLEGSGEYYAVGSKKSKNTGERQKFIDRITNATRGTRVMNGKRPSCKSSSCDTIVSPKSKKSRHLLSDSNIVANQMLL